jgi:hypothetical protein
VAGQHGLRPGHSKCASQGHRAFTDLTWESQELRMYETGIAHSEKVTPKGI